MKAVRDALELLLAVARRRDGSATPSAPAEELGLNVSTARRLLQDLADTGFIEQASRRGGYRPGPSAAYLFAGSRYRPELHAAFAAPLAAFAGKFGTDASLSVRLGPGRTVLLAFDGTGRETTAEYPPRKPAGSTWSGSWEFRAERSGPRSAATGAGSPRRLPRSAAHVSFATAGTAPPPSTRRPCFCAEPIPPKPKPRCANSPASPARDSGPMPARSASAHCRARPCGAPPH